VLHTSIQKGFKGENGKKGISLLKRRPFSREKAVKTKRASQKKKNLGVKGGERRAVETKKEKEGGGRTKEKKKKGNLTATPRRKRKKGRGAPVRRWKRFWRFWEAKAIVNSRGGGRKAVRERGGVSF